MAKKTMRKKARKKTGKKTTKKVGRHAGRAGVGAAPPAAGLAMNAAQFDDFYADELKLGVGKNARTAAQRRTTRMAAMILWREEDVGALVRDETGAVWGWSLRLY